MDYTLTEAQEMLRTSARGLFAKELPKSVVKEMMGHPKGYPQELWDKMAELGWTGLAVPAQYGGAGGSFIDLTVLLEEMGRACVVGPFYSTAILGALTLLEAGTAENKKEILPGVSAGKLLLTLAWAEPKATRPEFFEVRATRQGDGHVINGTKLFVPDAHVADYVICGARTDAGPTLFLVKAGSSGLECKPMPTVAGDKQSEVIFRGVKVSQQAVLGHTGKAEEYIDKVQPRATIARCAEMLGSAQQILDMSVAYAKERVQFGKPIGTQQAVQHHCANMLVDVEGCRYTTYKAAWLLAEGLPCKKEVAVAKAWANEACQRVAALGHQIHGAMGYQWDHDLHLYSKRIRAFASQQGDTVSMQALVASEIGLKHSG